LKIIIATTVHPPFDTRIYHKQFLSLRKKFKEVHIVIPQGEAELPDDFSPFPIPSGLIGRLTAPLYLFKALRRENPDLVIMHDPELLPTLILFRLLFKTPVIYDVHEDYPNFFLQKEYLSPLTKKAAVAVYRFFEKIAYKLFAGFIFADHFTRALYFDGVPRTEVIYNYPLETSYPVSEKKYDLIYPGTLHSGLHKRLLRIITELDKRRVNTSIYIVGKKPAQDVIADIEAIKSQVSHIKIYFEHDITFDRVQELIGQTKIGLIPLPPTAKYKNNIPTKMFEYLMHRLPQIGTDIPSISYYYDELQSAFCIAEEHYAEGYADKIEFLLKNYDEFQRLAEDDSKRLLTEWSWAEEEKKLYTFITKTIAKDL
jgi:glycosyltransferase involved in cell wall biosynthesis